MFLISNYLPNHLVTQFPSHPVTQSENPLRLNSVEQVLKQLETQPGWEKFRQHRQLLSCWDQTVNQQIAQHTRPLYIKRQILYVATNSAARAQELSFQRYALLKRLNQQLTFQIKDIRFSSSQWHEPNYDSKTQPPLFIAGDLQIANSRPNQNTSDLIATPGSTKRDAPEQLTKSTPSPQEKAKNAALSWLKTIKQRAASKSTIFCPNCQAITSKEELARWNLCHHCISQKWEKEYRPPTFPNPK